MSKFSQLEKIARVIEKCKICKEDKIGKAVPGEGNPDANVMFIGEAPGRNEAETGRPFIGRSGKLLRQYIREIGLKEEDVFITSPVKYLPKEGTPSAKEVAHGRIHLLKQIDVIKPKVIVLLGRIAMQAMFSKEPILISKQHGDTLTKDGRQYFLTYHPAAGIRFPPLGVLLRSDFQKLRKLLK